MKVLATNLAEVKIFSPTVFADDRGYFYESFAQRDFDEAVGQKVRFVQDNHSHSSKNVLRGLHFQIPPFSQGKLVRVVSGAVFDVAVDVRANSSTFGHWTGLVLSAQNKLQLWIPEGFAHGFVVLSDTADFVYKTTNYWDSSSERVIAWNDPKIGIDWPEGLEPIISAKDARGMSLAQVLSLREC